MKKTTMSIGLNDKDTRTQIITTSDAEKLIVDIISTYCDGGTVTSGTGIYRHADGEQIIENTIIVYLYDAADDAVIDAANVIKKALNQESIAIEISDVNSMFI